MLFFLAFGIFNDSKIPVRITRIPLARAAASAVASLGPSPDAKHVESHLSYKLDFFNYVPVALGFLGWLLFVMFAGIGLVSLPMDLIMDFFYQPQYVRDSDGRDLRASWRRSRSRCVSARRSCWRLRRR